MPSGCARVRTTSMVCGWHVSETRNVSAGLSAAAAGATACTMVIASAAAVASSSSDALAIGSPVRSAIIVWKFSSASSRPCEISAWYGVYCVYQPGFSRMLRWITGGVMQSE